MTPEEMAAVRPVIEGFAAEVFGGFARRDQRGKGELYLRGLLLDGKRKSMQPMAQRLGVDHQRLQQFVTTSTWDHAEVRRRLAVWAGEFVDPEALAVDDTGLSQGRNVLAGSGADVLRGVGQAGKLPGRGQRARRHRRGLRGGGLAVFLPESWDDRKPPMNRTRLRSSGSGRAAQYRTRSDIGRSRAWRWT